MFAGTVVITERGFRPVAPPIMPPALAWWASSLELSGLGVEQVNIAREFLLRATQLDAGVRAQMAYRIAADIAARISPPPPEGAPPEYVLAAVLAERHRRALIRMRPAAPLKPFTPPTPRPVPGPPSGPGGLVPPD